MIEASIAKVQVREVEDANRSSLMRWHGADCWLRYRGKGGSRAPLCTLARHTREQCRLSVVLGQPDDVDVDNLLQDALMGHNPGHGPAGA